MEVVHRNPTKEELAIIMHLATGSDLQLPNDFPDGLQVSDMDDGGMGSLKLYPKGILCENRRFGSAPAEIQFNDLDGIPVLATLNLDEEGNLFELDVWKVDFSPRISYQGAMLSIQLVEP